MLKILILATPILLVLGLAVYSIWTLRVRKRVRKKERISTLIKASGDAGEKKVQTTLKVLEKSDKRYKIYHNIKLGPDIEHTNEFDTLVVGPNGIFHIETKNYGGERGGLLDIDLENNWLLHKRNGYSKTLINPISQVNSHEYRLNGFLNRHISSRNLPTRGIIVLSCDHLKYRFNQDRKLFKIPILHRKDIIKYIKRYNNGKTSIDSSLIQEICFHIELMNKI